MDESGKPGQNWSATFGNRLDSLGIVASVTVTCTQKKPDGSTFATATMGATDARGTAPQRELELIASAPDPAQGSGSQGPGSPPWPVDDSRSASGARFRSRTEVGATTVRSQA